MNDPVEAEFEIEKREESSPALLKEYDGLLTPEMVAKVEAAVAMIPKVKAIALKVTNHQDWQKFGDKAYLNESGSKKLAALWGVSITNGNISEVRSTDEAGQAVITYHAKVRATMPNGRFSEEVGSADTKDDFFSTRWQNGQKVLLPVSEIDLTSLRKKAYTNALGRAVKAVLGYGNVLWEEVVGNVKDSGQSAQVDFKKASPAKAQTVASAEGKDLRSELWRMALEMASDDPVQAGKFLEENTGFVSTKDGKAVKGFQDPNNPKISDRWIQSSYGKVKELWSKEFGGPQEEPGANG